jgi:hypothetical protein
MQTNFFKLFREISIYLSYTIYMALHPFVGPCPPFQFLNLYTDGRTPWTGDQPVARQLPAHRTARKQNKRTQTAMPQVGLEPTTPAFERTKTVHALDCAATMIGVSGNNRCYYEKDAKHVPGSSWVKCRDF